jgi:hypothetical protein
MINQKMCNYQEAKIYQVKSDHTDDVYIGSTTTKLSQRFSKHKNHYKRYLVGKGRYITSFKILEYGDAYIELLEDYPCESNIELEHREAELIRELDCVNKIIPGRTLKEYYQDNKDKIKQYQLDNRDKLRQKHNCSCGGKYTHINRSRHMKSAKHREFETIKDTLVSCPCGCKIKIKDIDDHRQSTQHLEYKNRSEQELKAIQDKVYAQLEALKQRFAPL